MEVKDWDTEDVMEALAAISITETNRKKQEERQKAQAGKGGRK